MSIAKRLYLLILFVVIGFAGVAGMGIYQINQVYTAANYANVNTVPSLLALDEAFRPFAQIRALVWQHIASSDPAKHQQLESAIATEHEAIISAFMKYEKENISDDKDRALLETDRKELTNYDIFRDKIISLSNAGQKDAATDLLMQNQAIVTRLYAELIAHSKFNEDLGKKGAEESAATMRQAYWISIAISLAAIICIAIMGLLLSRRIVNALHLAVAIAQKVATGDLTQQIKVTSDDETGQLMQALKDMNANLTRIVGEVRSSTDTISTASSEIAVGNLDLSARTEQQAGSLEETAAAMEQITSTVKQNADNARQANQIAVNASETAIRGGEVVREVRNTMTAINASSNKIVDIISVIDGIAFQTNILALNAAVEAARAGEQGRGFAVVAGEVRSLAQRAAAAAKEIKTLISDSVEKAEHGRKLVEQAGLTMEEIVSNAKSVTDIVGEISAASQEQSTGIEEINRAITQMDETTQQNAALVEEATAASQSLQDQTRTLTRVVGIFKLDGMSTASSRIETHAEHVAAPRANPTMATKKTPRPAIKPRIYPPAKTIATSVAAGNDHWEEF
ncbi:methyl-accepting chemotaxis protein [Herbaspirillum sp. RTI4]|uniref:methyl-accepting chemotaxis protein n=1 Tax=Herbaspirillum sp. RTI4 TaxID=3048640 RepID=UPI002AB50622|nr:methyl-accepting chemotaxis protein [Herbaspirillum sp. RTI4]MDY7576758.1 methyl-accepting chemotaxis protein [Herbaspirillum sp. RTI4]MEA9981354.1 methyl-accepting chemotaxis protein [Herbaspirillum sp. RTI4]